MFLFSLSELLDLAFMIVAVGFIFKDSFIPEPKKDYDPIADFKRPFNYDNLIFSIAVTAPAIALHELSHKFVSLAYGVPAQFHAAYFWLFIGIVLKFLNFPFIFFVPGFVSHASAGQMVNGIIAFAGPATNLVLWLGSAALLKTNFFKKHRQILYLTSQINMFLFIFNMIPIYPFDGAQVFSAILGQ